MTSDDQLNKDDTGQKHHLRYIKETISEMIVICVFLISYGFVWPLATKHIAMIRIVELIVFYAQQIIIVTYVTKVTYQLVYPIIIQIKEIIF